jgi:hypothetical protein
MRALWNDVIFGMIIIGYLMAALVYLAVTHKDK